MSAGLLNQLESYGDVFAAAVDAAHEEQTMRTNTNLVSVEQDPTPTRRANWRPIAGALGAAAVFIAAVVGISVARDGDTPASAPFNDGEEAAIAFTNAWNAGDWDAVVATMSDDAILTDGPAVPEDGDHGRRLGIAADDAMGFESTVESCIPTGVRGGYDCTVTYKTDISEALGLPTLVTSRTFRLDDDGYIEFVSDIELPEPDPVLAEWFVFSSDLRAEAEAVWDDHLAYTEQDVRDIYRRLVTSAEEFMANR